MHAHRGSRSEYTQNLKERRHGRSAAGRTRPDRRTGSITVRSRTFSQAPRAVRSAGGCRRDRVWPSAALACRASHTNKGDSLRSSIQVHRLRHVSTTAAIRAVVRFHSSPPSVIERIVYEISHEPLRDCFLLRNPNRLWALGADFRSHGCADSGI
jgi:hypothetical protein